MITSSGAPTPSLWLPEYEHYWAEEHREILCEIYAAFWASGSWPEPVQLQRELRARGSELDLIAAVQTMPRLLGWREWAPERIRLSLFGIGCCPASQGFFERLIEVLNLALARFDDAGVPNQLTRAEVDARLSLDDTEADRLHRLIFLDPFFLGSGTGGEDDWARAIHESILRVGGAQTPDDLLQRLADIRGINGQSTTPAVIDIETEPATKAEERAKPKLTQAHIGALGLLLAAAIGVAAVIRSPISAVIAVAVILGVIAILVVRPARLPVLRWLDRIIDQ